MKNRTLLISLLAALFLVPAGAIRAQPAAGGSKIVQAQKKPAAPPKSAKKKAPPLAAGRLMMDPAVGKTASGKVVFEGSRGGFYYLSESRNRIYVQDFVGAKIVGKTRDGKRIYEGPRGGRFYYNDGGDKIYLKQ